MNLTLGVVHELEHEPVPHQIRRVHTERFGQPHQLGRRPIGRVEFPPELKPQQTLVEPPRSLAIGDAQPNVIENRSMTTQPNLRSKSDP